MVMKDLLPRAAFSSNTAAPTARTAGAAAASTVQDAAGAQGAAAWPVLEARLRKRNMTSQL